MSNQQLPQRRRAISILQQPPVPSIPSVRPVPSASQSQVRQIRIPISILQQSSVPRSSAP